MQRTVLYALINYEMHGSTRFPVRVFFQYTDGTSQSYERGPYSLDNRVFLRALDRARKYLRK